MPQAEISQLSIFMGFLFFYIQIWYQPAIQQRFVGILHLLMITKWRPPSKKKLQKNHQKHHNVCGDTKNPQLSSSSGLQNRNHQILIKNGEVVQYMAKPGETQDIDFSTVLNAKIEGFWALGEPKNIFSSKLINFHKI